MRRLMPFAVLLAMTLPAHADEVSPIAREVVEMIGALGQARAMVEDTAPSFAENLINFASDLPESRWEEARKAAKEEYEAAFTAHEADFLDGLASVYQELYTPAELEQLKAFYKTPMGKKLASRQQELMTKHLEVVRNIAEVAGMEATVATHQRLSIMAPDQSK